MREIFLIKLDFISSNPFFKNLLHCEGFNEDNLTIRILKRNSVDFAVVIGIKCSSLASKPSQSIGSLFIGKIVLPGEEV